MRKLVLAIFCGLMLASCGGGQTEHGHGEHDGHQHGEHDQSTGDAELDALRKTVDQLHDEVMANSGKLMKFKKQALAKADSLEGDAAGNLQTLANELETAHDGMMQWMRTYGEGIRAEQPKEQLKAFLSNKKEEMEQIKAQTEAALQKAEESLQD